ncbi:hypothetical protein L210DRAFT_3704949, partial [Boletus edulis BED1]
HPRLCLRLLPPLTQKLYNLITRRLQEVLGGDIIKGILAEGKVAQGLLGYAPSAHIEYYVPLTLKITDFLRAGVQVKILLADVHAIPRKPRSTPRLRHAPDDIL